MIKLKVGNVIYFRGTPEWLWKVLSVFDKTAMALVAQFKP